jgi:hypothetical protein
LLVLILDDRTLWKKDPDLYDNNMKVWEIGGGVYVALKASRVWAMDQRSTKAGIDALDGETFSFGIAAAI